MLIRATIAGRQRGFYDKGLGLSIAKTYYFE